MTLALATASLCLMVPPPLLPATSTLAAMPGVASVGDDALVNTLALGAFVSICAIQSSAGALTTTASSAVSLPPFPMPLAEDYDDENVCFPIGMEDCEQCEYNEEFSEFYGQPVWP